MYKGPPTRRHDFDFVEDLSAEVEGTEDREKIDEFETVARGPHIKIKIIDKEIMSLLDSGSQITAVSEEFFKRLWERNELKILPVSNLFVTTAIGKKSTTIKQQVWLEVEIEGRSMGYPFLVIPYLTSTIILGNDWMSRNEVVLNYKNKVVEVAGRVVSGSSVSFGRDAPETLVCSRKDKKTYVYVISLHNLSLEESVRPESDKIIRNEIEDIRVSDEDLSGARGKIVDEAMSKRENLGSIASEIKIISTLSENKTEQSKRKDEGMENKIINDHLNDQGKGELRNDDNDGFVNEQDFPGILQSIAGTLALLNERERKIVLDLLQSSQKLFSNKPGCAKGYEHRLKLILKRPSIRHTYPIPYQLREPTRQAIGKMIDNGVIQRAISQYCNPLRIVKKDDGTVRVCLDARLVNEIIEDDHESPPLMNELLQKFHGSRWFSKIDLTQGYWQIKLHEDSRQYTSFLFESKLYQFCRIPFGLKTAGSGFIRALSFALGNEYDPYISCYIDDIVIGTSTFEEHIRVLGGIFQKLTDYNFTLKISKCCFLQERVSFLGFVISRHGISPAPGKLDTIVNFVEPQNKKQLQQFLGVCNYYRQFNVRHSQSVDELRGLLTKNKDWHWTDDHAKAFKKLKIDFQSCIMLKHVIPNAQLRVQTDASDRGISGILYQIDPHGNHNVIAVISRCLTKCEVNYTTTEKELLAVVYAVEKFRVYLLGIRFVIVTDHQCLTFLRSAKFQNSRITRWILLLQQYVFTIEYCRGVDNVVADFFSRNPGGKFSEDHTERIIVSSLHQCFLPVRENPEDTAVLSIALLNSNVDLARSFKSLGVLQKEDAKVKVIMDKCNSSAEVSNFQIYKHILFHQEKNSAEWRIVIPVKLQESLIDAVHVKLGHPGVYKTIGHLKKFYYWKGMVAQVKQWVVRCDMCQRVKYLTIPMGGEFNFVKSREPNDLVTVDYYGPLPTGRGGSQYIFVMLDAFSKYVSLYPIKRATVRVTLNKIFSKFIQKFGKPKRILSDHGTQFTSNLWKTELEANGIQVLYSSIRHPQSNPTERVMRELGRLFRTVCSQKHTKWVEFVPDMEKILNITVHQSTKLSPKELHFGKPIQDDIHELIKFPNTQARSHQYLITMARENMRRNFENRKKTQKHISRVQLGVGDLVLLRVSHLSNALDRMIKKFFHLFEGPYMIIRVIGENAFVLVDPRDNKREIGTYNRSNLRKYYV